MLTKITLVLALCSGVKFDDVAAKIQSIQKSMPGVQVTTRIDKKAACYKGMILTGKDAKLLSQLGK